jgi:hypothetical protein
MKVSELISALQKLPQDADVVKSSNDGCSECNADGLPWHHDVSEAEYRLKGEWPNENEKHVVIL